MGPQQPDRLERHHAVPAAAVRDNLGAGGQLGQPAGQVARRDADGAGDVRGSVLGSRADIQHPALAHAPAQLAAGHRLQIPGAARPGAGGVADLGQLLAGDLLGQLGQGHYPRASDAVEHAGAGAPRGHQPGRR